MEILLVLALAALLLGVGWSSFKPMIEGAHARVALEKLLQALQFARREALLRQAMVRLCPSRDQLNCSDAWEEGFIVVGDEASLLQAFQGLPGGGRLYWRAFPQQRLEVQFLPGGTTNEENGTFWYCPPKKTRPVWAVTLAKSGQWRVHYPDPSGKLIDKRGNLLVC